MTVKYSLDIPGYRADYVQVVGDRTIKLAQGTDLELNDEDAEAIAPFLESLKEQGFLMIKEAPKGARAKQPNQTPAQ